VNDYLPCIPQTLKSIRSRHAAGEGAKTESTYDNGDYAFCLEYVTYYYKGIPFRWPKHELRMSTAQLSRVSNRTARMVALHLPSQLQSCRNQRLLPRSPSIQFPTAITNNQNLRTRMEVSENPQRYSGELQDRARCPCDSARQLCSVDR
jgi:hypothetical protein